MGSYSIDSFQINDNKIDQIQGGFLDCNDETKNYNPD